MYLNSGCPLQCLRVDKVTSGRDESVQKLKGALLVHGAQHALPGFAQAHGTELQWRDSDACGLGEDSIPAQRSGRFGCGLEKRHVAVLCSRGLREGIDLIDRLMDLECTTWWKSRAGRRGIDWNGQTICVYVLCCLRSIVATLQRQTAPCGTMMLLTPVNTRGELSRLRSLICSIARRWFVD